MKDVSDVFVSGGRKLANTNRTQLFATAPCEPRKSIRLKAAPANSGTIYVGAINVSSNVSNNNVGYPLSANEAVELYLEDLTKLYVVAGSANDTICWVIE